MADTDHPTTDTDEATDAAVPPGTPQPAEAETTGVPATSPEGAPDEDAAEEDDEPTAAEVEAPAEEPEPEPAGPRFGAQFSSPEPTAVVARPRRRATRPTGRAGGTGSG
ncbi:hypothetical protein E9549_04410, partial [Blastococcus sp. MG754426]